MSTYFQHKECYTAGRLLFLFYRRYFFHKNIRLQIEDQQKNVFCFGNPWHILKLSFYYCLGVFLLKLYLWSRQHNNPSRQMYCDLKIKIKKKIIYTLFMDFSIFNLWMIINIFEQQVINSRTKILSHRVW